MILGFSLPPPGLCFAQVSVSSNKFLLVQKSLDLLFQTQLSWVSKRNYWQLMVSPVFMGGTKKKGILPPAPAEWHMRHSELRITWMELFKSVHCFKMPEKKQDIYPENHGNSGLLRIAPVTWLRKSKPGFYLAPQSSLGGTDSFGNDITLSISSQFHAGDH